MKIPKEDLTLEMLEKVLKYDALTGHLTWISKSCNKRIVIGSRAGSLHKASGYRHITIFGTTYGEHIICYYIHNRQWPKGHVDHDNHIRDDNRAVNLKDTTMLQNMRNRGAISNTITGHQGIWYCKRRDRYVAEITMNRKKVWQRTFKTANEAAICRAEKLIELGFHENHGLETKGN